MAEFDNSRVIQVFLWCVAALFLCAFTSLYTQIPGLYGENGLTPAAFILDEKSSCRDNHRKCKQWSKQKQCKENAEWMLENCAKSCNACKSAIEKYLDYPTLLWCSPHLGLSTETGMELVCLLGILLSFFMLLSKHARDCLNYALLWILYFSLVQAGQIFLYYQWDNLILEISFFAVLLAPWNLYLGPWNIFKCTRLPRFVLREHDMITWWLIKWLLFRLMFASGIVKLLWMDETWWNLTALNWHYESQCIPTALAWYMQKLPIPFHRLCVVITYLIEITIPFLFFAPFRSLRIFAFYAQMLLQSMILVTGNYNFFNLATMALCLSLVDDKFLQFDFTLPYCCKSLKVYLKRRWSRNKEDLPKSDKEQEIENEFMQPKKSYQTYRIWSLLREKVLDWLEWKLASKKIFNLRSMQEGRMWRILRKTIQVAIILGTVSCFVAAGVVYFGLRFDKHEFIHSEIKFTPIWFQNVLPRVVESSMIIGIVSLVTEILKSGLSCWLKEYDLKLKVVSFLQVVLFGFGAIWIFGITLVPLTDLNFEARNHVPQLLVNQHKRLDKFRTINAYGLFRSMTGIGGRPEVVIMGSDSLDENATWKEYNFIYKPGNLHSPPTFNVPHQPRLDWQMWFAAIEDFASNPWFVHLTYKLLIGEKAVLDLMSANPFKKRPPKYIRSVLYRYHYSMNTTGIFKAIFNASHEKRWWTREYVNEFMPIVSKNDSALIKMLRNFGLIKLKQGHPEHKTGWLHHVIKSIRWISRFARTEYLIYAKFGLLVAILLIEHWWNTQGVRKSQNKRKKLDKMLKDCITAINSKISKRNQEKKKVHPE